MIKLRHIVLLFLSLSVLLLLPGCDAVVLNPKGPIAAQEKQLLIDALALMLIIVIPVIVLTLLIAFKYRASNKKAKYTPNWAHGTLLEAGWWIAPILIVSVLAVMTWRTTHELDPYKPLDSHIKPVTIQVVALEWRWLFIYPEQNIATINTVEFPANTPINFVITSDAPMNSFQIQGLAGQIYAMAGMQTKLHLLADAPGEFNGRSVSFSGPGFANMMFTAKAVTNDQFNAWVDTVKKEPNKLSLNAYNALVPPTEDTGVYYFSAVEPNLFNDIIMKYMGPDAKDMFGNPQKMSGMPGMSADQPMHNTETEEHHHA